MLLGIRSVYSAQIRGKGMQCEERGGSSSRHPEAALLSLKPDERSAYVYREVERVRVKYHLGESPIPINNEIAN